MDSDYTAKTPDDETTYGGHYPCPHCEPRCPHCGRRLAKPYDPYYLPYYNPWVTTTTGGNTTTYTGEIWTS